MLVDLLKRYYIRFCAQTILIFFFTRVKTKFIISSRKYSDYHAMFNRSTDESIGLKERRRKDGRIPNLSALVKLNRFIALPFVCKIKSPSHMKNIPTRDCQSPDFIKLCHIMKGELDHMRIIETKVVFGLLVENNKQASRT